MGTEIYRHSCGSFTSAGGTPVEMVNANRVVSNAMGNGQTQNSQPTWAPPGDLFWVAFNSQREYGAVLPTGKQQIWVAAINPAKLGSGQDPSFPEVKTQIQSPFPRPRRMQACAYKSITNAIPWLIPAATQP